MMSTTIFKELGPDFEMVETNWKTNIRVHDLELRSFNSLNNYTWDIVKWIKREGDSEFCIALAYWLINEKDPYDGSDLKFVGARPFADDVDQDTFMMLAKIGQNLVDKWNIGVNGRRIDMSDFNRRTDI